MDGDTEKKVTESSKNPKEESQRPLMDHTFRGHGFKSRGGGGRIGRGGMRGGRGMMKGFEPPGYGRGRSKEGAMNGFTPMRGMRRMRPYPDPRNHRGRGGPMGMGGPMCMGPPPPFPPPMHMRGPFPPMPRHRPHASPPPGHPGFRGLAPHPRGRSMLLPGPPRHFHHSSQRGFHNGPVSPPPPPPPPHPPPGRGQRWPGPPGGRRF
ncbi:basic salivary proline-rich protein 2 isoform X2 [Pseudoliparis swirei]|uniref:basic salivary proline-rich protein 2 isoform X2 n=1 Tax=Pseudoliparis swirei TaxID=2059687 RepID=UPI0024BE3C93|nr:basic salivary proline-rich protein 2 isoform X2 [Pseudoliparis swirei]